MIFLIVNMVIGIAMDIMFVVFMSSDGFEYVFRKQGMNPEAIRRDNHTISQAILNGMVSAIPVVNTMLLILYVLAHLIFNRKKGS